MSAARPFVRAPAWTGLARHPAVLSQEGVESPSEAPEPEGPEVAKVEEAVAKAEEAAAKVEEAAVPSYAVRAGAAADRDGCGRWSPRPPGVSRLSVVKRYFDSL